MIAKLAYAALFCAVLPGVLVFWAWRLDALIGDRGLPVVHVPMLGAALALVGLGVMVWSMAALRIVGGGLPMNAFPPPRHVRRGPYRFLDHPIYVAAVVVSAGIAVFAGSPAGLWIATPIVALGAVALVLGYEGPDLDRRFGRQRPKPILTLPPATDDRPHWRDAFSAIALVLIPWLLLYEAIGHLPVPGAIEAYLPFERGWPVIEWTEALYASVYPVVILAPVLARSRRDVRRFMIVGWIATALGMLAYLVIPVIAPPRDFAPTTALGHLLMFERADGLDGRAAFPSFHVFWTLLAAWTLACGGRSSCCSARRGDLQGEIGRETTAGAVVYDANAGWLRATIWMWALAAIVACVTTGMHALVDLVAGALLFVVALRGDCVWEALRRMAERVANSWCEWRLGPSGRHAPTRIIVHGLYAGTAAAVGMLVAGSVAGPDRLGWLVALMLASLLGAALWGQAVVSRPTSARPFGFFGSVVGIGTVALVATLLGADLVPHATAVALAAPWIQAIGRLRCLVQGCCHGARTAPDLEWLGIRYAHERSRVCRLSDLGGVAVHPTPLYSILANVTIGLLLLRLHLVGAPATFVLGGYFLLAGVARFVEEAYRGEPHTPIRGGLRLYQWLAIVMTIVGVAITMMPTPTIEWPSPAITPMLLAAASLAFVFHFVAMGVDWPESDRRFARLA